MDGGRKRKSTEDQEALLVQLVSEHLFKTVASIRELGEEQLVEGHPPRGASLTMEAVIKAGTGANKE